MRSLQIPRGGRGCVFGGIGTVPSKIIEPIPDNLVREPMAYLFAEHYRQSQVCNQLEQLVRSSAGRDAPLLASQVRNYLTSDFALQVADELLDFFAPLLVRCEVAHAATRMGSAIATATPR